MYITVFKKTNVLRLDQLTSNIHFLREFRICNNRAIFADFNRNKEIAFSDLLILSHISKLFILQLSNFFYLGMINEFILI